jgi:hypothetical protein
VALATKVEVTTSSPTFRVKGWFTPCPAIDRAGEASWRDTPVKGGQARMQMSIHVKVVGLLAGFKGNVPTSLA